MSLFNSDLNNEQILGQYLDEIYRKINIPLERVIDKDLQHKGVDIIYQSKPNPVYIDEKAQLHYINSKLSTFTFELSYLKDNMQKVGWLLDKEKITQYYFLVTGIFVNKGDELTSGVKKCKITSVNRSKLIQLLKQKGLNPLTLELYNQKIRNDSDSKYKTEINELNIKTEGCIVYSEQLVEKPINIMLKLNFLIQQGVAKQIYPKICL